MKISSKPLIIAYIIIIIAVISGIFITGDTFTIYIPRMDTGNDEIHVEMDKEGIVEVASTEMVSDSAAKVTLKGLEPGTVDITVVYVAYKDDPNRYSTLNGRRLYMTSAGILISDDDMVGNMVLHVGMTAVFIVTALFFCRGYLIRRKKDFFSYRTILDLDLAMYFTIMTVLYGIDLGLILVRPEYTSAGFFFNYTENILSLVVLGTLPLILVFAVYMGASNLRLISKEGFRTVNLLGIFIGLFMIGAVAVLYLLLERAPFLLSDDAGSLAVFFFKIIFSSAFLYFEVTLFATIICIQKAGRFNPKYDKDFIIILGCAIRKDGTLYPLIQGRVDRALDFFRKQRKGTGREAVFVPSGGQGSDEVISEGEAMKRYLMEQGMEEEWIIAETESTTTLENMKFSRDLILERDPDPKVVFSTTNYHVFRAGMLAREAGLNASGIGSKTKWYFWPNAEVREFIGLIVAEIWVHIGVVLGLSALSVFIANFTSILKFFLL